MRFTRVKLQNWRNFTDVDVCLQRRVFLVGPNAAGKSNLLDAFRFLRDLANPRAGFQSAVLDRQSVSQIRSLHARQHSDVLIEVEVELANSGTWGYQLTFNQDSRRRPVIKREIVRKGGQLLLERPDSEDVSDPNRLTQTHLEQVNANRAFRPLADFLAQTRYFHIVPQLVREPNRWAAKERDPFGGDFLEQIAQTPPKTVRARLRRINSALRVAVPQLADLELYRDDRGVPHLRGLYEHWRPNAGWQTESQFSDGTLRLLGLLWVLIDGSGPVLLEEPELSLHTAVVRHLPSLALRLTRRSGRQVLLSTQSCDLLSDPGIPGEAVLLLKPSKEGTGVSVAADDAQIRALLEGGVTVGEAVLPAIAPKDAYQLSLFGE